MTEPFAQSAPQSAAFVFVCQGGELEVEALLLAASMIPSLPKGCELIAIVPTPSQWMPRPARQCLQAFERLKVRVVEIHNPIVASRRSGEITYLLTNKIFALTAPTRTEMVVFLDSDQFCWNAAQLLDDLTVTVASRRLDLYGARALAPAWLSVFSACGVTMPPQRFRLAGELEGKPVAYLAPPAFNSSLVAVRSDAAADFVAIWTDSFERLDRSGVMRCDRYHTEEVTLAVAVARFGRPFLMCQHGPLLEAFSHYISPERVVGAPYLLKMARRLAEGLPELHDIPEARRRWSFLWEEENAMVPAAPSAPPVTKINS